MNRTMSVRAPRTLGASIIGVLLVAACVLALPAYARAATWTVGQAGGVDYSTVTAAIVAADPGDTILVGPGDYVESITIAKPLTLTGSGVDQTTLTGSGSSVISIMGPLDGGVTISGFRITGGIGRLALLYQPGGGIYCDFASPTITDCTITGNRAGSGGGIFCAASSPTITNCTITGNTVAQTVPGDPTSGTGGGIYCLDSSPAITNCTISDNTGTAEGGGIYCLNSSPAITDCSITGNNAASGGGIRCMISSPAITDCTISGNNAGGPGGGISCGYSSPAITGCSITGNYAASGAGIQCGSSSPTITNCIIADNVGESGGGIRCGVSSPIITNCTIAANSAAVGAGIYAEMATPIITNSIVWGNEGDDLVGCAATYSAVGAGATGGTGNTSADPQFVDAGGPDYRLTPSSPCVDTGTDTSVAVPQSAEDKNGIPRPQGTAFDMGAYEFQKDLYVEVDGSNETGHGTIDEPYKTIPHAIGKAVFGATVHVGSGEFWGSLDGDVNMKDGVSLIGAGSSQTTLWGWGSTISATDVSSETTISGFTITGGDTEYGGGIHLHSSSPAITGCFITDNWAGEYGGGVYAEDSSPRISDCTITFNEADEEDGGGIALRHSTLTMTRCALSDNYADDDDGGALSLDNSTATVTDCDIIDNWSDDDGGGVYCWGSTLTITNCVVAGNDADHGDGGGILVRDSSAAITNCTVTGNTAYSWWDAGGGIYGEDSDPVITNCIVWGNSQDLSYCSASYSDIGGGDHGEGGFSADPLFVSAETGDYRLAGGSPCIDTGNPAVAPAFDKDGVARPQPAGGLPDMGAYESSQRTLTYTAGPHGSVVGKNPQMVAVGGSGSLVEAVPDTGYRFERWVDTNSADPDRVDTNVLADVNAYAVFVRIDYTLTYTAGAGGSILGASPQTVPFEDNATPVQAKASSGYHFVKWSDTGSTDAQRIDFHVSADIAATAIFASDAAPLTLTYTAGPGGSILGASPQSVPYKGSGTEVVAKPASGYHFLKWSDNNSTDPKRTDTDVQDHINATALFAKDFLTLSYTTTTGGSIVGSSTQTVAYGGSGSQVVATPDAGYHFVKWADTDSMEATRTDTGLTADISAQAQFAVDGTTMPTMLSGAGLFPAKPTHGKKTTFHAHLRPAGAAGVGTAKISFYRKVRVRGHKTVKGRVVHYWKYSYKRVTTRTMSGRATDGYLHYHYTPKLAGKWKMVVRFTATGDEYTSSGPLTKYFKVK